MDPLASFRSTIQGANAVTPSASPLGASPEIANFYKAASQLPQSAAGAGALAGTAGTLYKNQQQQDEYARQEKIASLKDKVQEYKHMNDPSKFKQVLKPDGGYDFFDPLGNKINIQQYSQAVGKQPSQILSHSENNLDRQYTTDYKKTEETVNAIYNNDKKYFDKLKKDDPEEYNALQELLKQGSLQDGVQKIVQGFQSQYPNIYSPDSGKTGNVRSVPNRIGGGGGNNIFDTLRSVLGGIF